MKKNASPLLQSVENVTHIKGKGAKIFSMIIIAFLCLVLSIGGIASFFTKSHSHNFIMIDGKEILTPQIIEVINSQLGSLPPNMDKNAKVSQILQSLQPSIENALWSAFASRQGVYFTPQNIGFALKDVYNTQKNQYEKTTNNHFYLTYGQFLKNIVENFNASLIFINTQNIPFANPLNVLNNYALENTFSQVEYQSLSLENYLLAKKPQIVIHFYNHSKNAEVIAKNLLATSFSSEAMAQKMIKNLQNNPLMKDQQFKNARSMIISAEKNKQSFSLIEKTAIGSITAPFKEKGIYWVGKIINDIYSSFTDLDKHQQFDIAHQYIQSLKEKERNLYMDSLKKEFYQSPLLIVGFTNLFKIQRNHLLKDAKNQQDLIFTDPLNQEFNIQSFHPIGYQSPVLIYENTLYQLKVLQRKNPSFPIAEETQSSIEKSINDLEKNYWYLGLKKQLSKEVSTNIYVQNIESLFFK